MYVCLTHGHSTVSMAMRAVKGGQLVLCHETVFVNADILPEIQVLGAVREIFCSSRKNYPNPLWSVSVYHPCLLLPGSLLDLPATCVSCYLPFATSSLLRILPRDNLSAPVYSLGFYKVPMRQDKDLLFVTSPEKSTQRLFIMNVCPMCVRGKRDRKWETKDQHGNF